MKSEELKGKRLAVFGANNVVDEVTAYARKHGIVLVSVGNVPEAPMHQASDEQYYIDCTENQAPLPPKVGISKSAATPPSGGAGGWSRSVGFATRSVGFAIRLP